MMISYRNPRRTLGPNFPVKAQISQDFEAGIRICQAYPCIVETNSTKALSYNETSSPEMEGDLKKKCCKIYHKSGENPTAADSSSRIST